MINYLKDCQQTTLIGQLPDIINSNNNSIKNEFNWIFDSSLNRLTKSVYAPTGSVKAHFGEFVNLACEYITVKNVESLVDLIAVNASINHNILTNRFYNQNYNDRHDFAHDAATIIYQNVNSNTFETVQSALQYALSNPFESGNGLNSGKQKNGNNVANGAYSLAEGKNTITNNEAEHAAGKYNLSNSGTINSIGIGNNNERKNAVEVLENGDVYVYGIGGYNGTNPNNSYSVQQYISSLEARIVALEQGLPSRSSISEMDEINSSNYVVSPTPLTVNSSGYVEIDNASLNDEDYLV